MKKALFRLAAIAVALAFPTGVFAQTTSPTKAPSSQEKMESKETKSTETKTEGGKKTTKKKSSKKTTSKKTTKKPTPAPEEKKQ